MKTLLKITLLFSLSLTFTLSSCKKGPEDPAISLRSRKARISGEWKLTSAHVGITYHDADVNTTMSDMYEIDKAGCTIYETPTGSPLTIYKLAYSLNLKISDDGTFTLSELAGNDKLKAEGIWNFTSGVGDSKNKEGVIFNIKTVSSGSTDKHLFNRFRTEFSFNIDLLKNKEMKLNISAKTFLDAKGSLVEHTGTVSLFQS